MAYVVDPLNVSKPADSDFALVAAEELRSLKASVTTRLADAATAVDTRLDAVESAISAIAFKTCEEFTGSGTWTVPDGITKLLVLAVGGGTCVAIYARGAGVGGIIFSFFSMPQAGMAVSKMITVVPGTDISYACGTGQTLTHGNFPGVRGYVVSETVSATNSTFGSVTAKAARSLTALNPAGTFKSKEASTYSFSDTYDGKFPPTLTGNSAADSSFMAAGDAGTILVFY